MILDVVQVGEILASGATGPTALGVSVASLSNVTSRTDLPTAKVPRIRERWLIERISIRIEKFIGTSTLPAIHPLAPDGVYEDGFDFSVGLYIPGRGYLLSDALPVLPLVSPAVDPLDGTFFRTYQGLLYPQNEAYIYAGDAPVYRIDGNNTVAGTTVTVGYNTGYFAGPWSMVIEGDLQRW